MTCFIAVDKREREVLKYAHEFEKTAHFQPEHLTTGDFIIFSASEIPLFVIERKTWADLASSIKDGRIENIEKLKQYREHTGARIAYLIEGADPVEDIGHMPVRCMRSHLDHLIYRDHVHEIRSKSAYDSARRLAELAQNLSTLKEINAPESAGASSSNALDLAKKVIVVSDNENRAKMWCAIPTIADKTALVLAGDNVTFKTLFKRRADKTFVADLNAKIGPARAGKLVSLASGGADELVYVKILSAIHGISANTASRMLSVCSLEEMVLHWDKHKEALENVKIGKTRIGPARIEKVGKLLGIAL